MIEHLGQKAQTGSTKNLYSCNTASYESTEEFYGSTSFIFKELFCRASRKLAREVGLKLEGLGQLHEEILKTSDPRYTQVPVAERWLRNISGKQPPPKPHIDEKRQANVENGLVDDTGRMCCLAKHLTADQVRALRKRGFRFAKIKHICPRLAQTMHVSQDLLTLQLERLGQKTSVGVPSGTYLCGIIMQHHSGKDPPLHLMVKSTSTNHLPGYDLGLKELSEWHRQFIKPLDNMTVVEFRNHLERGLLEHSDHSWNDYTGDVLREDVFSLQLLTALEELATEVGHPRCFGSARFTATPFHCAASCASFLAFRLIVDDCEEEGEEDGPDVIWTVPEIFDARVRALPGAPNKLVWPENVEREWRRVKERVEENLRKTKDQMSRINREMLIVQPRGRRSTKSSRDHLLPCVSPTSSDMPASPMTIGTKRWSYLQVPKRAIVKSSSNTYLVGQGPSILANGNVEEDYGEVVELKPIRKPGRPDVELIEEPATWFSQLQGMVGPNDRLLPEAFNVARFGRDVHGR